MSPRTEPSRKRRATARSAPVAGPVQPVTTPRMDWLVGAALVGLHLFLAFLVFDPTPHTGGDNAAYIALGRSILERGEYVELYDPALRPHTQYPPVFPGVLAVAMLLGISSWIGFKAIIVAASALAVGFVYLWTLRRSGFGAALAVGMILAAGPGILDLSHWVLSDVPFWALTAVALWGFERVEPERRAGFIVALSATVLAYFTRSAGLPLIAAAGIWLTYQRRWRGLAVFAAILLPLALAWTLRDRAHGGIDYVNQFWLVNPYLPELGTIGPLDLLGRILDNARRYATVHLPVLAFGRTGPLPILVAAALAVAGFVGWGLRLRRPGVAECFFPLYIGLILVWPAVWAGERFLLPAYPLLLAYAADAVVRGIGQVGPMARRGIGIGLVGAVMVLSVPALSEGVQVGSYCRGAYRAGDRYPCLMPQWKGFYELADWAGRVLPDDAVVISRKPRLFYALSGLRGRIYPLSTDADQFFALVDEIGARYVVMDEVDRLSYRYLGQIIGQRPGAFCFLNGVSGGLPVLLGILPAAEMVEPAQPEDGAIRFATCPADYLRSLE